MEVGISILSFDFNKSKNLKLIMKKITKLKSDILCFQNIDLITFNYIFVRLYEDYRFFKSHFNYIRDNDIGNIVICSISSISKKDITYNSVVYFGKSQQKKSMAIIKIGEVYFISVGLEDGKSSSSKKIREIEMINLHNFMIKIRYCVLCGVFYQERFYGDNFKDIVLIKDLGTWHFDRYVDSISKPHNRIITKYIHPIKFDYFWVGSSPNDILSMYF